MATSSTTTIISVTQDIPEKSSELMTEQALKSTQDDQINKVPISMKTEPQEEAQNQSEEEDKAPKQKVTITQELDLNKMVALTQEETPDENITLTPDEKVQNKTVNIIQEKIHNETVTVTQEKIQHQN